MTILTLSADIRNHEMRIVRTEVQDGAKQRPYNLGGERSTRW